MDPEPRTVLKYQFEITMDSERLPSLFSHFIMIQPYYMLTLFKPPPTPPPPYPSTFFICYTGKYDKFLMLLIGDCRTLV